MAGIKYYAKMFECQLFVFSLFIGIVGTYFILFNFLSFIKIEVSLTMIIGLFLIKNSVGGFASILFNSDKIKIIYAYFILIQIIITFVLLISSGIMIKPDPDFKINLHNKYVKKDLKYLDPLHTALKCCYMRPIELSTSFIESSQFKEIVPIDSCCPILNSKGQCVPELAYKNKCDEVYYKKVKYYKIVTLILLIVVIISQILMFFSFYKNVS